MGSDIGGAHREEGVSKILLNIMFRHLEMTNRRPWDEDIDEFFDD